MSTSAWLWLLLNILSIGILSFFSMMEMACVSFHKVRLQYYTSKNNRRALLITRLLQKPTYLFGTTLVGVNIAMFFGSEFARQFHAAIGINPDFSPLTQVLLVVIFGELAPMFAARRYPEHMALLGIPFLYAFAILLTPFLWLLDGIVSLCHRFAGTGHLEAPNIFLTQEELQKIFEESYEEKSASGFTEDFNAIVANIFSLRGKTTRQIMTPFAKVSLLPANCSVKEVRYAVEKTGNSVFPLYQHKLNNIVGVVFSRDLIRDPDHHRAREKASQPWFVAENIPIMHLLNQFRKNNESLAIVINELGQAIGIIALGDLMDEVFGETPAQKSPQKASLSPLIDQTLPGDMQVEEFNKQFRVHLAASSNEETLADLMSRHLGHSPEEEESVFIAPFELIVKERSLLEIKSILVKTIIN